MPIRRRLPRRVAHRLERLEQPFERRVRDVLELLAMEVDDHRIELVEDIQSSFGDEDADQSPVAVNPSPLAEAELLEAVDEASHVRHFGDDLRRDLVATATLGPGAAQDAEDVVARLGELKRSQQAVGLPADDGRGADDGDERFLGSGGKRVPLPQFNGEFGERSWHVRRVRVPEVAREDACCAIPTAK